MRVLLFLLCMLNPLFSHAQKCEYHLYAENYIHVRFSCHRKDNWPIFFEAFLKNDTLSVNLENLDEVVASLYSVAEYVPMSPNICLDAFAKVFRISKYDRELYDDINFFINDYYNQFDKYRKEGALKLGTGDVLKFSYANVRGVFTEIDKSKYISSGQELLDTSNGIKLSLTNKVIVPVAVSNFSGSERDLVIVDWKDGFIPQHKAEEKK